MDAGDAPPVVDGGTGLEEAHEVVQQKDGEEVEHRRTNIQEHGQSALAPTITSEQDARDGGFGGLEGPGLGPLGVGHLGQLGIVLGLARFVDQAGALHLGLPQIVRQLKGRTGPVLLGRNANVIGVDDVGRAVLQERIEIRQEPIRQARGLVFQRLCSDAMTVHQRYTRGSRSESSMPAAPPDASFSSDISLANISTSSTSSEEEFGEGGTVSVG